MARETAKGHDWQFFPNTVLLATPMAQRAMESTIISPTSLLKAILTLFSTHSCTSPNTWGRVFQFEFNRAICWSVVQKAKIMISMIAGVRGGHCNPSDWEAGIWGCMLVLLRLSRSSEWLECPQGQLPEPTWPRLARGLTYASRICSLYLDQVPTCRPNSFVNFWPPWSSIVHIRIFVRNQRHCKARGKPGERVFNAYWTVGILWTFWHQKLLPRLARNLSTGGIRTLA